MVGSNQPKDCSVSEGTHAMEHNLLSIMNSYLGMSSCLGNVLLPSFTSTIKLSWQSSKSPDSSGRIHITLRVSGHLNFKDVALYYTVKFSIWKIQSHDIGTGQAGGRPFYLQNPQLARQQTELPQRLLLGHC